MQDALTIILSLPSANIYSSQRICASRVGRSYIDRTAKPIWHELFDEESTLYHEKMSENLAFSHLGVEE